ncbi:DNA-invertase [Pseudocitrobacter sp. RIT415]|uniref:recombinase family protein n=1 Tax=Pseudocitrobacter sp. RIT415 TaxID=2202163 RepID=UPI000D3622D0|nr:recombinase family protein [Pseudocitrobacter sp. RIT 415]RAU45269.1 DNA-invertase [Pseudocitrobacter sp. RIT 415]
MRIGYVRVSTIEQNPELKREAIERANCELIFEDKMTGTKAKRPGLNKLLKKIRHGDTVVVWKLDRLGRSLINLADLLQRFKRDNIQFLSLTEGINTSTSMGRFTFHIMSALAEMERDLIVERTRAGLAIARKQGRIGGRRPKYSEAQWAQMGRLILDGMSRNQVAIIFDVGISTLYRKFPAARMEEFSEQLTELADEHYHNEKTFWEKALE